MEELLKTLVNAPTNTVLILAGLAFLAVAVFGRVTERLDPGPRGRMASGVLGAVLLAVGLLFPTETHRSEPTAARSTSSAPATPSTSATAPAETAAGAPSPSSPTSSGDVAGGRPTGGYPKMLANGQVVKREGRTYTILKMQLDENDAKELALEVTARVLNEGSYPGNFWNDNFRLIVDGVPYAPVGSLDELVQAHAAKEGVVKFAVPKGAKILALQIDRFGPDAPSISITVPQQ